MTFLLSYPNVFEYLIEQGICTQEEQIQAKVELKYAKNFNLLLRLPQGRQLLVKQDYRYREGKSADGFLHEWRLQKFLQRFPEASQIRSWILDANHFDVEHSIIVFNYLNDYSDLMGFYGKENIFPMKIGTAIGTTLATIHRLTIDRHEYQEFFFDHHKGILINPAVQLISKLERISPEIFGVVSADGLKFFALYQRYENLREAIAQLTQVFEPCCLTHNDLKLDNILLSIDWNSASQVETAPLDSPLLKRPRRNHIVRLIDWEHSSWGDPAFDLGTLIASYLQMWLSSLITSKALAIDESLCMTMTPLAHLKPSIAAVAIAYFAHFPEVLEHCPNFLQRVVQFSGLALIQQILSTIQHKNTFGNSGLCMLQVAKMLLCSPQESISTVLGIEVSKLTHPYQSMKCEV